MLAALSGGVDSVALFLLLTELRDRGWIRLTAAHFDHRIRAVSGDDAAFVCALCEKWAVPLVTGREEVRQLARVKKQGLETAAREARYAFLYGARNRASADVIALAHHMDDQAETVLMHLFRGSGISGLKGMRERENALVRPLLHYKKQALISFVETRGEGFCEDQTNAVSDTPRNALRIHVLPEVSKLYPGATAAVSRLSEIAAREDDYLSAKVNTFFEDNAEKGVFGVRLSLKNRPHPAILCRALARLLPEEGGDALTAVLGLAGRGRGAMALTGGCRAEAHGKWLYLLRGDHKRIEGEIPLKDGARLPGIGGISVKPASPKPILNDLNRQVLSRNALEGACLRTRRPGDRIFPFAGPGTKKLSDYLIDKKIDRPLRDYLPLVARGNEVLWVAGVGISERARLSTCDEALELTFIPETQGIYRITEDGACTNT